MHVLCSLYAHTWTYAWTMYICILYMQVLNRCLAVTEFVSCRLTSIYCAVYMHTHGHMHVQSYTFFTCRCSMSVLELVTNGVGILRYIYMYAHTWTYACTIIYILYMQVLNECLGASDEWSWHPEIHLHVFTVVYCAVVYTHMDLGMYHTHGLRHVPCTLHCLHAGADLAASNRQNWCPAASVYICMYVQVCYCAVVCTHFTVHLFYRCLRGSNISNITF